MEFGKKQQIGNFTLLKYKKGDRAYIKIEALSKEWSLEYGEGNSMFVMFDNHPVEDSMTNPLMLLILNTYYASMLFDAEYQTKLMGCIGEFIERSQSEISEEEDAKILDEMRKEYEIKQELEEDNNL